ncbi:PREDICTED: uncharacterized protein LOC101374362 [Odobenus rosmarus divergens]|uniref:Uncharacterized protein LOC101374362 n=1 Tax=Odobenus rosmarus divergens TaxID=9708 RepID=A0A9B0LHT7_ODORO
MTRLGLVTNIRNYKRTGSYTHGCTSMGQEGTRHRSHSSQTSLRMAHVTKGHTRGGSPATLTPMGGQVQLAASSRGAGREGPRPAGLQDGTEASGLSSLTAAWSPTPTGLLAAKADGAGIRGFCTRAPSPVRSSCPTLLAPRSALAHAGASQGATSFLGRGERGKAKSFLPRSGKQECAELVGERAGLCWPAGSPPPCPPRPLGHPHPAHRRRFSLC